MLLWHKQFKGKFLKGKGGPVELNGEEIYQIRCSACHKFDVKLVGPPHNEVVPKYFGKEKELIAYIKNPTKIDPNYPPMPNLGLKPNEVKAVVDYVLEQARYFAHYTEWSKFYSANILTG